MIKVLQRGLIKMSKRNLSLSVLNSEVLEGKIEEGDYLEIEENDGAELVFYANHRRKILTARRGGEKSKIKSSGRYIEIVEYNGLPQAPTILTFRVGSEDYSRFDTLLIENHI